VSNVNAVVISYNFKTSDNIALVFKHGIIIHVEFLSVILYVKIRSAVNLLRSRLGNFRTFNLVDRAYAMYVHRVAETRPVLFKKFAKRLKE